MRPPRQRITVFRKVEERNTVGEVTWKFMRAREIWATLPQPPDGTFETKNTDEIYPGWVVMIGEALYEVTHVRDRLDAGLKIVEIGIRACATLPHVMARGMARPGFRGVVENTETDGEKP